MDKVFTGTAGRALELLGNGVNAESVAAALGVTPSYISTLIADEEFTTQLVTLKYEKLSKHNERDDKYNSIEDKLLEQLESLRPLMMRPMEVLRAIQVVNAAKRRGAASPDSIVNKQALVQLTMPIQLVQKFTTNINNQVVEVEGQELVTIDSKSLLSKIGRTDDYKAATPELTSATSSATSA